MEFSNKAKKKVTIALIILTALMFMLSGFNLVTKGTFVSTTKKMPIYSVDTKDKKVAITFDASWGSDNTDSILNTLDKYNVKATFFLVGEWCDDYPDKVKAIAKRGHEIGNHSNKHLNFTTISKDKIITEVEAANAKILSLTGETPKLFRFPEGLYSDLALETVESSGLIPVQWDVDSVDWKAYGADKEYDKVVKNVKPGSIVLFHNDAKYTPETLPKIIESLQDQGYEFVKISDLIIQDGYYVDNNGKQARK
ncbi:polysaccharide deacetylase family sporulation protein PdaB [Clostridium sp.]|uniref:polysaccharide deacetylase family sporulation protein PdaB n=1 Tax=Clostridium sp. TaxID=1506 RepID=UPI002FC9E421